MGRERDQQLGFGLRLERIGVAARGRERVGEPSRRQMREEERVDPRQPFGAVEIGENAGRA